VRTDYAQARKAEFIEMDNTLGENCSLSEQIDRPMLFSNHPYEGITTCHAGVDG
jgi:hypothetical protein